jgi:hypothetical protein
LAYSPASYFEETGGATAILIGKLRLSRARSDGIASAVLRMGEAAAGLRPRRSPVRVTQRKDGLFDVLDGNSTVVVAAAAGWRDLPCLVGQPN